MGIMVFCFQAHLGYIDTGANKSDFRGKMWKYRNDAESIK